MFCWHKWSKWSDPMEAVMGDAHGVGFFAVAQHRICEKCGKAQYRRLPELRSLKGLGRTDAREASYKRN